MKPFNELLRETGLFSFYKFQPECEGYWDNSINEEIYQYAKSLPLAADVRVWSQDNLTKLRDKIASFKLKILEDKSQEIDEHHRYPMPEIKPWPGKDQFLRYLLTFEMMGISLNRGDDEESELRKNIIYIYYKGYASARLPIKDLEGAYVDGGTGEYRTILPSGKKIGWTEALYYYVQQYNVIPSQEFLNNFQELIEQYKDDRFVNAITEQCADEPSPAQHLVLTAEDSAIHYFKSTDFLARLELEKSICKQYLEHINFDNHLNQLLQQISKFQDPNNPEVKAEIAAHDLYQNLMKRKNEFLELKITKVSFKTDCIQLLEDAQQGELKNHRGLQKIIHRILLILTVGLASLFGAFWNPETNTVKRINAFKGNISDENSTQTLSNGPGQS